MPTSTYFEQCPAFPSDIPTADIPILSYKKLEDDVGGKESDELFEACVNQGFFMLDLKGTEVGERVLRDAERMFELNTATFDLGIETLLKYKCNLPKDPNGYKQAGVLKTDDGKLDAIEAYNVSRDDVLGLRSTRQDPEIFTIHRQECQEFFTGAYAIISDILEHLDKHLALNPGTLASLCSIDKPSATSLRLLQGRPEFSPPKNGRIYANGHTDIGVITMLFHIVGGLQVLPPGSSNIHSNWRYVRPQQGCALFNIGDSLVEWTGGLLRSCLHRVFTPPGEQAAVLRQSLAYLIRANESASMKRLESDVIPRLSDDEEEETKSVQEWASWRAQQIMDGVLKAETRGGRNVSSIGRGKEVEGA